nr:hypothetical protein [Tanacetum cinerariifolium]
TSTIALVISSAAPVVETTIITSPTRLCGLIPYSDYDSPDEMASPEYITSLPATLPFLFTDSSKDSDPSEASDSSEALPSHDPYVIITRQPPMTLIQPGETIPFGRPYRTHPNRPHSAPVHSSGLDAPDQAHSRSLTRVVSPRLGYPLVRAPRHRSLTPTHADLLPPCKRLRDSYSPETSMEEDTEIDTTETEDGRDLDIVDGDYVRDHIKVDLRDDREE